MKVSNFWSRAQASAFDAAGVRLRQLSPGDPIWPAGAEDETAASMVADEPCRTVLLTAAARSTLEKHEERLALRLYRYLLAGRFPADPRYSQ